MVFATFVAEGVPITIFLDLLEFLDGKKNLQSICDCMMTSLIKWSLDIQKCVGFRFDGAAIMLA